MQKALLLADPEAPQVVTIRECDTPSGLLYLTSTDTDLLLWWLGPHPLTTSIDCNNARDDGTTARR